MPGHLDWETARRQWKVQVARQPVRHALGRKNPADANTGTTTPPGPGTNNRPESACADRNAGTSGVTLDK